MGYTTPRTWNAETVTNEKWIVELKDNLNAIKDPPSQNYEANEGTDYTKTLAAWANVDTDYNFSITTTGGDVLIGFMGTLLVSGGGLSKVGYLDVAVDGTRIINTTDGGLGVVLITGLVSFTRLVTGLAAGVHTFNLQWKPEDGANTITLYAGAGTASYDLHPQFWVRELT